MDLKLVEASVLSSVLVPAMLKTETKTEFLEVTFLLAMTGGTMMTLCVVLIQPRILCVWIKVGAAWNQVIPREIFRENQVVVVMHVFNNKIISRMAQERARRLVGRCVGAKKAFQFLVQTHVGGQRGHLWLRAAHC